jgi:hypothetical protein
LWTGPPQTSFDDKKKEGASFMLWMYGGASCNCRYGYGEIIGIERPRHQEMTLYSADVDVLAGSISINTHLFLRT